MEQSEQGIRRAYERMDAETDAHSKGEEVEADKRLNDAKEGTYADFYCDPQDVIPAEVYGFDPRGEAKRPNFERTTYQPKACSFNQILELWAAHEGGRLLRVIHVPGKDSDSGGEDDARRAWEWVAATEGWNSTVHEVMRHLVLRARSWDEWPCGHVETTTLCPWPPHRIPKATAGAAWVPFYRNLRKHYRLDPFTINAQSIELA